MYKKYYISFLILGILFLSIMGLMIAFGGNVLGIDFPRNDIVHIGFGFVGFMYLMISFTIWYMSKDKQTVIEDKDERNNLIVSMASSVAYLFQNLLLLTAMFLMTFMGYMNKVSMFTLCTIFVLSFLVFLISRLYYSRKI